MKYTEQEVRDVAFTTRLDSHCTAADMLTAYADLLAAKEKAKCMLTDAELSDPDYVRAYIEAQSEVINDLLAAQPVAVPDGWLYTLEYGASIVDRKISLDRLRYPFGVCGSDYLRVNDDGVSYVREMPLYLFQWDKK